MDDIVLEAYEVGDLLGHGSFGEVYKVVDRETSETRAIKFINMMDLGTNQREVIQREVKILGDIECRYTGGHPNIVRLHGHLVSKDTDNMYLIMELIEGGDLGDFLKQHGPLPVTVAQRFVKNIANALQFLRTVDIIHRDLKPDNLLVTSMDLNTAVIKVADFGLARNLRREDLTGTQCGTPLYQAPEQHENSLYGEKIDLWSVGAILYEMVTGRKVFDVQTMKELHTASQSDPHIILSPTVDKNPHCRAMLMGLLKKVPAERMTYDEFFIHPFLRPDLPSSPLIQTQGGRGRGTSSSVGETKTPVPASDATPTLRERMGTTGIAADELVSSMDGSIKNTAPTAAAVTATTVATTEQKSNCMALEEEDNWELVNNGDFDGPASSLSEVPTPTATPLPMPSTSQTSTSSFSPSNSVNSNEEKRDTTNEEKKGNTDMLTEQNAHVSSVVACAGETTTVGMTRTMFEPVVTVTETPPPIPSPMPPTLPPTLPPTKTVSSAPSVASSTTSSTAPSTTPPFGNTIALRSINQIGKTVLFFLVRGLGDHVTYRAYSYNQGKKHDHYYLDVECVEALRRKQRRSASPRHEGKEQETKQETPLPLPGYFIGTVILCFERMASPTQNPYQLPEGTVFTSITAVALDRKIQTSNTRLIQNSTNDDGLSYLSFQHNDIVLGIPGPRNINETKGDQYVVFNETFDGVLYRFSDESVAAFRRKQTRALTTVAAQSTQGLEEGRVSLIGRIVMMENEIIENDRNEYRRICTLTVSPL